MFSVQSNLSETTFINRIKFFRLPAKPELCTFDFVCMCVYKLECVTEHVCVCVFE